MADFVLLRPWWLVLLLLPLLFVYVDFAKHYKLQNFINEDIINYLKPKKNLKKDFDEDEDDNINATVTSEEQKLLISKPKLWKKFGWLVIPYTQNPLEQEGTYPLPEAQLDRFIMHLQLNYPDQGTELQILRLNHLESKHAAKEQPPVITQVELFEARKDVLSVTIPDILESYIINLTMATRRPYSYDSTDLARWISCGVSPRATMALANCSRVKAWLDGRNYVAPEA